MKRIINILVIVIVAFIAFNMNCYAKENSIILNTPKTDDINHTFKYPDLKISNDIKPYSITLSIENGYFNTNNEGLNDAVSLYFDFIGGTNTGNDYISTLNTTENYKLITFNLNKSVDISNKTVKTNVINSIRNFLSDIVFKNDEDKDAKFTLTFSELELSLSNTENNLNDIKLISFKDPSKNKEHYYAKIEGTMNWTEAYNIATSLRWNGMQGYLATITSEAEHNFIYQSLGSIEGWIGAAAILNAENSKYNEKNIAWQTADNEIKLGWSYGYDTDNDNNIKQYWTWVAGPEAGQKIFDGYTNFSDGEPNNSTHEAFAEYGYGYGGMWNDYANDNTNIEGYYIEFGGFEDEQEATPPVSLVNTFKWKDYDFRNIKSEITDSLKEVLFDEEIKVDDVESIIDPIIQTAIEKSGVDNVTYEILNKKIEKDILSFDIEITIGEEGNQQTYTIHFTRRIKDDEIDDSFENPPTGDNILKYIIISIMSIIGVTLSGYELKKKF